MLILRPLGRLVRRNRRLLRLLTFTFIVVPTVLGLKLLWYIDKDTATLLQSDSKADDEEDRELLVSHAAAKNTCLRPKLVLWHPELASLFSNPKPLACDQEQENWITVKDGKFLISDAVEKRYGKVLCQYVPILRGQDDFQVSKGRAIKPMKSGSSIDNDVFEAKCVTSAGAVHSNIYIGVSNNSAIRKRSQRKRRNLPANSLHLNVVMFGFDSVSRMTWMRNLPKSHAYFTDTLKGVVLEGYNIVGDGTPQALLPILTGKSESELPEARRGFPNAANVDDHPWIWKELANLGYVTQWAEDSAGVGTFTYRMLGFKKQPVDHYMRTFYLVAEKWYPRYKKYCFGSLPRHLNMLNWMRDFVDMYRDELKFSFVFHSEYSHDGHGELGLADEDLLKFLMHLNDNRHLNNTLLILMSDHGARFQDVRHTEQGKYEERMPYFGVRLPSWFSQVYPTAAKNLLRNAKRLTTPFDIYATFRDVISFSESANGSERTRGISLLRSIPDNRTCKEAGIATHWCTCLQWTTVSSDDAMSTKAATSLVDAINQMTDDVRNLCSTLSLYNVSSAKKYVSTNDILKFRRSLDPDGRVPDLSDDTAPELIYYQLVIETHPGNALFEATVKFNPLENTFTVSGKEISRINKYGSQPHCIANQLPHLRPFCLCT